VRDLANELGKRIDIVTSGADTELDRQLIELIRDPITHLIRNCADHGLESPEDRRRLGKREVGTIRIAAAHDSGYITIDVGDDGRGLDVDRIRQKALAMNLASESELARLSNDEVCRFIFAPGFSTAAKVTSVSGRGVGMDVVRENIEAIGGTVSLKTTVGAGTTFTLKIPLTLAIAPALIVRTAGHRFALPQHAVVEAVAIWGDESSRLEDVQGALMLHIRDSVIPCIDLRTLLKLDGEPEAPEQERLAVIMRFGPSAFGVVVDTVSDVQEIVVKPLGRSLSHLTVFSGNTILGDGSVVLILNPNGLATHIGLDLANHYSDASQSTKFVSAGTNTRLIVFRAGEGPLKALPLSLVSRIETVGRDAIEDIDGMKAVHHLGKLMPVIDVNRCSESTIDKLHVLVIGVGGEPMGLLVSEIVDIVEDALAIEIAGKTEAVIGSTTIAGQATEIIDLQYYMRIARPDAFARGNARRYSVLLVDDKPFFRDMLAPVVAAAGYEVRTAASGAEVLELIKHGVSFDALVTDIDMPGMNGYLLAQRLREDPSRQSLPIVALDAHAGPNIVAAARAAGMAGAVGKFDRKALLEQLKAALGSDRTVLQGIEAEFLRGVAA
jgi:two-component system chemotaxis sensor kinase CheA